MTLRFAPLLALLALLITAASPPPRKAVAPAQPAQVPDLQLVELKTEGGTIVVELNGKAAPVTVRNFLRYVDTRRMDGATFYRAMHLAWGDQPNGLLQGGARNDPRGIFPPIAHEPTTQTGLTHKAGTISMANGGAGTATADFFILLSDMTGLDADPAAGTIGFAAFGRVVSGMDVVRRIWDQPRSPTKGEGAMRGQMLEVPVKVITARRIVALPVAPPVAPPIPPAP